MEKSPESSLSLEQVLIRKSTNIEYTSIPTHIEGVSLRLEEGKSLDLNRSTTRRIVSKSRSFFRRKNRISALNQQQQIPDAEIKGLAKTHDGFRGVESSNDNFRLTVYPSYKVSGWVSEKLRAALGLAYPSVVSEQLNISVTVPLGQQTEEGPITSEMIQTRMFAGLIALLGVSEEDISSIAASRVDYGVDEQALGRMIADGKVHLGEDAATVEESWSISTDSLKKS